MEILVVNVYDRSFSPLQNVKNKSLYCRCPILNSCFLEAVHILDFHMTSQAYPITMPAISVPLSSKEMYAK